MYCKRCGREGHYAGACVKQQEVGRVTKAVTRRVTKAVTEKDVKHCPTCTCQRVHENNAAKQKAYRERKAEKGG